MNELKNKLERKHQDYRRLFYETVEEISVLIESVKPDGVNGYISDIYEKGSAGFAWQSSVKSLLENKLNKETAAITGEIRKLRTLYDCAGCGVCCRFAVSEFSFQELQIRAKNGDKTAQKFVETFVPYNTLDDARQVFPEYVELLENNTDGSFYIYHCPKVTQNNRCPDYENRPEICRDFPDNPAAFLPVCCGYSGWKSQTENLMLKMSVLTQIINFYLKSMRG